MDERFEQQIINCLVLILLLILKNEKLLIYLEERYEAAFMWF